MHHRNGTYVQTLFIQTSISTIGATNTDKYEILVSPNSRDFRRKEFALLFPLLDEFYAWGYDKRKNKHQSNMINHLKFHLSRSQLTAV